jgi:outer membrane protein OmpA-like peptidoglycan-associated protein
MDRLATFMKESPQHTVVVEGHTDSVGTEEYNQQLSERRASAVREALTTRGVDAKQIATVGKGEGVPVASNDDSGGRQQNRRVEIIVDNSKSGERVTVDK